MTPYTTGLIHPLEAADSEEKDNQNGGTDKCAISCKTLTTAGGIQQIQNPIPAARRIRDAWIS